MFQNTTNVAVYSSHSPFDGPPDAYGGNGLGFLLHRTQNVVKVNYSFAVNGGALGLINLYDDLGNPCILPPSAVITRTFSNWPTALTSLGSATISQGSGAAVNDLKTATAVASYTGLLEGASTGASSAFVALGSTAAGYRVGITVAVAALTAGVGSIYIYYVL